MGGGVTKAAQAEANDRKALTKLFQQCGGAVPLPGWKRQRFWLSDKELFLWDGVTCDEKTGRVTKLILIDNNLYGQLPDQLASLTELQELDFSSNRLSGRIPESLLQMENLKKLRFLDNPNLNNVKEFRKEMKIKHPEVKVKIGTST